MASLLNRLAWFIAILFGVFFGFLIGDLFSGTYTSGAENFFSWAWMLSIIITFLVKWIFLSANSIEQQCISQSRGDMVTSWQRVSEVVSSDESLVQDRDEKRVISSLDDSNSLLSVHSAMMAEKHKQESLESIPALPTEPDKPNWFVEFFSDRPLAKIWGILLLLGALFFLSLVWAAVWEVGKIIIGLLFGFSLYAVGVWMDKKGHTTESRTLLWVGIAINTLTILSGRWIIGTDDGFLSDTMTLIFLLFNTIFAVFTALVYSSRTFLIFSFVFAYLIPFLVWSESSSIVLMLLYTTIISLSGYMLAYFLSERKNLLDTQWLFKTILIGSTLLIIATSFGISDSLDLGIYILITMILTGVWTWIDKKIFSSKNIWALLLSGYILLIFALFQSGSSDNNLLFFILALAPLMIITVLNILLLWASLILSIIFFFPLIVGLFLFGTFGLDSVIGIILPIVLFYGIASFFILGIFSRVLQYGFFILLWIFLSIWWFLLDLRPIELTTIDRLIFAPVVLLFFIFSLYNSTRLKLEHLTLASTTITAILFGLLLHPDWTLSWIFYLLFLLIAFGAPIIIRKYTDTSASVSLILYQVIINIFMISELIFLGENIWFSASGTSLIMLWVIVFGISIGSMLYSFVLVKSYIAGSLESLPWLAESRKNLVYGIFALPISLFSLAIAIIFSDNPAIVSAVWIIESTIFAFLYGKTKNTLVLIGACILLFIGLIRLVPFFDMIQPRDWIILGPLSIIAVSLFLGIRYITPRWPGMSRIYDILHIFGILAVGIAVMQIIPSSSFGWSLLGWSLLIALSTFFYDRVDGPIIHKWLLFLTSAFFLYHLGRMESLSMDIFPIIIQLSWFFIAFFSALYFLRSGKEGGKIAFTFGCIMGVIITSLYVNDITENVFAVTLYLTLLSTLFILRGISLDRPYYRTAGLYIGAFALCKILFYDLWVWVDNLIIRVIALMVSGGVMIALSQLYGNSVRRSWTEEFSWDNFHFSLPSEDLPPDESHEEEMPFSEDIAITLKDIDISDISSVQLRNNSWDAIFETKRVWILRISKYITTQLHKESFAPGELSTIFQNILPHIRSSLPKDKLDILLWDIMGWISTGWTIAFTTKNK